MGDFLKTKKEKRVKIEVPLTIPANAEYEIVVTERAEIDKCVYVVQESDDERMTMKIRHDGLIFVAKDEVQRDQSE
jgi:hypothetical protein